MLSSIFKLLVPAKTHTARYAKANLRFEQLETRDTPAAMGFDDVSRAAKTIDYGQQYVIESSASRKVIKQIEKKNTLALKDLSPGNHAQHPHPHAAPGHKIIARR